MIGHIGHVDISGTFEPAWIPYEAFVLDADKPSMSWRTWDYGAIIHYANFQKDDIVVDIGGGASYFFIYLTKFVKECWCVDPLLPAWNENGPLLKSLEHYQAYIEGRARIHIQNARKLPFPDNSIDKIITTSAMEHFENEDDIRCAEEIYRVLKPGGLFLGTVDHSLFGEYFPEKYGEARFYTYQSFMDRIYTPSKLELTGSDFLKDYVIPEMTEENKYIIGSLFFRLRKE